MYVHIYIKCNKRVGLKQHKLKRKQHTFWSSSLALI